MNETLEAIARALFKSWFVDFDPVRAKMEGQKPFGMDEETAALFPDAFENSSIGDLPIGWKAGNIGDIAANLRLATLPEEIEPTTRYIGLEHMPRRSIALADWGLSGEVVSNKFRFQQGNILFGKLRPYFHKVGVAVQDGVCSTDILVITTKTPEWFGFAICHLSSDDFIKYVDAASTGTKMPRTNWNDMARYEIPLSTTAVAKRFNEILLPLIQYIRANIFQSHQIASIRDLLLPKLLLGEIRVKDAEKLVETTV